MEKPNLQSINHAVTFEIATPRQAASSSSSAPPTTCQIALRAAFTAPAGCILVSADYSQIELRLVAQLSNDVRLLELLEWYACFDVISLPCRSHCSLLTHSGTDMFEMIARRVFQIPPPLIVMGDARNRAKKLTYSILYGMWFKQVALELGCRPQQAQQFIDSFFTQFPGYLFLLLVFAFSILRSALVF